MTVFTCCNGFYKSFVPLFISSFLNHNPMNFIEVGVDVMDDGVANWASILRGRFDGSFIIRQVQFPEGLMPNAVRFITEPTLKSDYIYICDVDMIFLESDIEEIHMAHLRRTGALVSNLVRPKQHNYFNFRRLTGLHFTQYEKLYPPPPLNEIPKILFGNDEALLYHLVALKGVHIPKGDMFRPIHGIHLSPNKQGLHHPERWEHVPWITKFNRFRQSDDFKLVEPLIKGKCRELLDELTLLCA